MANLITTLEEKNSTVFGNKRDLQDRCTVMRTKSETFFYCNTPEGVGNGALADSGKYLLYKGVRGSGHLYTWHQNETSSSIYSVILIYNANSFPIQVNFTNIGLTNLRDGNDSAAWQSYYTGNRSESAEIPAGGYKSMLVQSGIAANNVFGKIARFSITNKNTGATAAAFFYDLAYRLPENSGNAHAPAACDIPTDASLKNSKRRGLGDGFYNYLEIGLS